MSSKWLYHSQRWYKQQLVVQRYYMNKDKHIPQGYKSSPLGIIPMEWEVKRLGEVCSKITDGTHGTPQKQDVGVPYLTAIHIKDGFIDYNNCYFLSEDVHNEIYKRCNPEYGDVLMVNIGAGIGAVAMNKVRYEFSLKNVALLKPTPKLLTGFFLELYLLYSKRKNIHKLLNGGAQPFWGIDDITRIHILLPSIAEQNKFEDIICLWDAAIEKQSELIEKLTLRKRALMQKLLTGKKRLPGFSGKWKRMTIKEFAKEVSIKNVKSEDCIVLSCTKYDGLVSSLEYFGKQIYSNDLRNYKIVPRNHFVYATNHIEEGSIGYQANYDKGLISPMYTVFYTDENIVDDSFLFAILKSHHLIYLYQSMMEGSINRRGGLRWDSFSTIKIDLPPLNEQKSISAFIKDLDKEIELANEKLAKLKSQKRGLMQQLLTGKKRIK